MFDILTIIPGKKKLTGSGWHTFNGICCHHRGHRPDKRMRAGIKFDGNNWSMHCFNCSYKCNFILGKNINPKTKKLLSWCGIDDQQISKWSLESLQQKDLLDISYKQVKKIKIKFTEHKLPDDTELLDGNNPKHKIYADFVMKRGINFNEYPFLVTPNAIGRSSKRIIIPYTYKNKIVGLTSRFIDDRSPKYINEQQPGYIFGLDFQKPEWQVCLVVEGVFDAISLNACAILHNTISENQALILSQLNKPIIVVPDQDKTGLEICERALELGYQVSLPKWAYGVKDANDAVIKYGKLATLLSILENATNNKIKIEMRKKAILKHLK